jgi:hypothetical protein
MKRTSIKSISLAAALSFMSCSTPPPPPFDFKAARAMGWFTPETLPPAEKPVAKIPQTLNALEGAAISLSGEWRGDQIIISPFNGKESPANIGRNKRRAFNTKVSLPWGFRHTVFGGQDAICETSGKVTLCLFSGYSVEVTLTNINENLAGVTLKIVDKLGQETWQAALNQSLVYGTTSDLQVSLSSQEDSKKKPEEQRVLALKMSLSRIQAAAPKQSQ